jgi:phage gpG-like protein
MEVTLEKFGVTETIAILEGVKKRWEDRKTFLEQVGGDVMLVSILRNFDEEGRPMPWAPLAPATIKDRIKHGYGEGPILYRNGTLLTSNGILHLEDDRVMVGTDYVIAGYMQEGSDRMPARIIYLWQDEDLDMIEEKAMEFFFGEALNV